MADPTLSQSIDTLNARNNTAITILVNGNRVGRIQQFSENIQNNVQVLTELGSAIAVELKKGITLYTFTIAKLFTRNDAFAPLKLGAIFSLMVQDTGVTDNSGNPAPETLEFFRSCSVQTIGTSYTNGAATIAQNCSVVAIGKGITTT